MNTDYSSKVLENMHAQLEKTYERKRQLEGQRSDIDALIDDTNAVILSVERFISTLAPRVHTAMPNVAHMDDVAGDALQAALHDVNSHLQ